MRIKDISKHKFLLEFYKPNMTDIQMLGNVPCFEDKASSLFEISSGTLSRIKLYLNYTFGRFRDKRYKNKFGTKLNFK